MTRKTRDLILAAAGLAVLIILAVIVSLIGREPEVPLPEPEPELEDKRIILSDFKPEDFIGVSVINEHGDYTVLRLADGSFGVPELLGAVLNQPRLHTSARYISELWAVEVVAENAQNLEQYGLGDTAAQSIAIFESHETRESFTIFIGDKTPTAEDMTYVRRADSSTVYAVWSYLVDWAKEPAIFFASLFVTPEYSAAGWPLIDSFVIDRAGHEQYVIELIPRLDEEEIIINTHKLTAPVEVEVDHVRGDRIIQGLFGLTAAEVIHVGEELPEKYAALFENPDLIATMTIDDYVATLTVSDFYGFHSDHPDVLFAFSPAMLSHLLTLQAESIMASMFHRPMIFTVSELIIETPLHTLSFTLEGSDQSDERYFQNGEPVDTNKFKDLYIFALMASAETLFRGTPQDIEAMPLLASYTYKYRDGSPDTVISFLDSGDMRSVIVIGGEPRFTTRIGYLTRLEQNLEAFINNEPIINSW
jgi:hypothetical protein